MTTQAALLALVGIGALIVMGIIIFVVSIVIIIAQWLIYKKGGKPGWAVLIPIYNEIILLKLVGRPVSWIVWFLQVIVFDIMYSLAPGTITGVLMFLSVVTCCIFAIIVINGLSKSFGKGAGFTVGLLFLPFIFYPILGFGKATYIGPGGKAAEAVTA